MGVNRATAKILYIAGNAGNAGIAGIARDRRSPQLAAISK